MRQLSDEGRVQSHRIGNGIQRLKIPVGSVLSSEYCRAREIAQLMNLGPVFPNRALMNMWEASFLEGCHAVRERARKEIGRHPGTNTNTVLVAHRNLVRTATGAYTDEDGAAAFAAKGDGMFTFNRLPDPGSAVQRNAEVQAQP